MALLSWKKLQTKIEILPTQKMYFKQYLYKLELLAYGSRSIGFSGKTSIQQNINQRLANNNNKHVNYGGSWHAANAYNNLQKADVDWLEFLKSQKLTLPSNMRFRIEEPKVQVYSTDEDDLLEFANQIPKHHRQYLLSFYAPNTDRELELLQAGIELRKKPPKYRYKVNFRDGKYSVESKISILNYLEGLEEQVWVPQRCQDHLTKSHNYIWDTYVYINDIGISTFLRIIDPNLVRSITELASVAEINTDIVKKV